MKSLLMVALVGAACAACATPPLPAARVGSADAAIREARESGADRVPAASLHLRLAEAQVARARTLIDEGEPERAEWLVLRAEADASVAAALAREAQQKSAADRVAAHARDAAGRGGSR